MSDTGSPQPHGGKPIRTRTTIMAAALPYGVFYAFFGIPRSTLGPWLSLDPTELENLIKFVFWSAPLIGLVTSIACVVIQKSLRWLYVLAALGYGFLLGVALLILSMPGG